MISYHFIEKIISCDKTLKILNLFRNDNPIPIKSLGKCIDLFSTDFINKKEYNMRSIQKWKTYSMKEPFHRVKSTDDEEIVLTYWI